MFIMSIFIVCFGFFVGFFPVFDDDFLFFGTQVDRNSACDRLIELSYVVTSDIVLALGGEMVLHDSGETIDEDVEWFSIVFVSFFLLSDTLEKCHDISRTTSTVESEVIISGEFHDDIGHAEECCPP